MDSLINALNLLKNDGKKMSGDIGISIKTLNEFLSGSYSEKTKKLVISYLRQKQDALNAHMDDFDNETIQTGKSDLINKNQDVEIIDTFYKSSFVGTNAKVLCYVLKNKDGVSCNKCIVKKGSICHNKKMEDLHKNMKKLYSKNLPLKINENGYYYFDQDYEFSAVSNAMSVLTGGRRDGWTDLLVEGTNKSLKEYTGYIPTTRNKIKGYKIEYKITHELDSNRVPSKELRNFAIKYLKYFDIEGNSALILTVEALKLAGGKGNLSKDIYPYILKYYPEEAEEHLKYDNGFQGWIIANIHRYTRGFKTFGGKEAFITEGKGTGTFSLLHIKL